MATLRTLRRYWREVALVLCVLLPWAALFPLGILWLLEHSLIHWWLLGASLLGLAAFVLRLGIKKKTGTETEEATARAAPASVEWGPREQEAWRIVEQISRETGAFAFTDLAPIRRALERTVDAVAEYFHPGAARARLRITLPEALLLSEQLLRNLRLAIVRHVPGACEIRLSDAALAKLAYDRYGVMNRRLYSLGDGVIRVLRAIGSPKSGLVGEANRLLVGEFGGFLSLRLRSELTKLLIREVGKAAIDLYSGRLRLDAEQAQSAARAESAAAATDLVGPVRILLAGQVNAGKSSLMNALSERIERTVGVLPTREASAELIVSPPGRPEVVLIDTLGIGSPSAIRAFIDQTRRADLILWVASAAQPARSLDIACLQALRDFYAREPDLRAPPILCALTHIDQMSPQAEWEPPYDLLRADRPKAKSIRECVEHVSDVFHLDDDAIIPAYTRSVDTAYNIDLLWDVIAANLDEARAAKLRRLQLEAGSFSAKRVLAQMAAAGRWLARSPRQTQI